MVAAFAVLLSSGCLKALVTAMAIIDVHSLVPELMERAWYDHVPVSMSKQLLDR